MHRNKSFGEVGSLSSLADCASMCDLCNAFSANGRSLNVPEECINELDSGMVGRKGKFDKEGLALYSCKSCRSSVSLIDS